MKFQTIHTNNGELHFQPMYFDLNMKPLDKRIAKENLLIFKEILDKNHIPFSLAYGTLLGAVREKDFIEHDQDIDIALLDEYRENFIDTLKELISHGFKIGRYEKDLLSIVRKDEYIDIYIFRKYLFKKRIMNGDLLPENFLIDTVKYNFLNKEFDIPKDYLKCLEFLYGINWNIPVKNFHASSPSFVTRIKIKLNKYFPKIYRVLKYIKITKSFVKMQEKK